jgi:hypothetical protein
MNGVRGKNTHRFFMIRCKNSKGACEGYPKENGVLKTNDRSKELELY